MFMLGALFNLFCLFKGTESLTSQPLTAESVTMLHSLIQFENLLPRFTAVVPPCWSEIQQEQQQRRHPQHLQQQGESTQHTRTWKLTADSGLRLFIILSLYTFVYFVKQIYSVIISFCFLLGKHGMSTC